MVRGGDGAVSVELVDMVIDRRSKWRGESMGKAEGTGEAEREPEAEPGATEEDLGGADMTRSEGEQANDDEIASE
jgi:hypothetical protein